MISTEKINTEKRNPNTTHIDSLPTLDMVSLMHRESKRAFDAVDEILPAVAQAVDRIADGFSRGGHLYYVGAGTSGRLGVLDASECPPTFGVDDDLVVGIIAGGDKALRKSSEGRQLVIAEVADGLVKANHALLDDIFPVCAYKEIGTSLGPHEIAVLVDKIVKCRFVVVILDLQQDFLIRKIREFAVGIFQ